MTWNAVTTSVERGANTLLRECNRQEHLIYSGDGVPATDALAFIRGVRRVLDAVAGIESMDTRDDIVEMFEEAL